jgi:hypothetical protein
LKKSNNTINKRFKKHNKKTEGSNPKEEEKEDKEGKSEKGEKSEKAEKTCKKLELTKEDLNGYNFEVDREANHGLETQPIHDAQNKVYQNNLKDTRM